MGKNNIPRGVQLEFEDIDYWRKLPKNKYVELPDGTKISVYEWMKKFMHENYGKGFDTKDDSQNILQDEQHKKEARRNNNNTNRDAFLVARKMGALNVLFQIESSEYKEKEEGWEREFKVGTYNSALKLLLEKCSDDLEIKFNKSNARALLRVYFRVSRFIKMLRRDKKTQKECKREKA